MTDHHTIRSGISQIPTQTDNANAGRSAPESAAATASPPSDTAAHQSRLFALSKSSVRNFFRPKRGAEEQSIELQPLPLASSSTTADSPPRRQTDGLDNATINEFVSRPQEIQTAIFRDTNMPAFDIVALAQATGKTYDVVLDNYLPEPSRKREFILANAPFMEESDILKCIEKLPPAERAPVLLSLSPFIHSREGKIALARHVQEVRVPAPRGMMATYLDQHHGAKQEPVLGALRSIEDPKSTIKHLPTQLRANGKWIMNLRQGQAGLTTLHRLDHDGQSKLLKKLEACIKSEPPEFAGYTDGLLKSLEQQWETLPLENKAHALRLIVTLSTRNGFPIDNPAQHTKRLADLLDEVVATPHSPVLQKEIVRMVKVFCKQDDGPEKNCIALLKKLGDMGPKLHAAPTYDLRPGYNVQGYAYKLFKHQLARLSTAAKGEVAAHWAKQNLEWDANCRPFSKKHWRNMGYTAGALALVGGASGGIAIVATMPAIAAGAGLTVAGAAVAKSAAISSTIGIIVGGTGGITGGSAEDLSKATVFVTPAPALGVSISNIVGQHGAAALSEAAIVGSVAGGVTAGMAAGMVTGHAARKISSLATQAVAEAGGVRGVGIKLRKNPITSIQTAVQRTASDVFSFDNLPKGHAERARAVQELGSHWTTWVEAMSTFPPARKAKVRADLEKVFDAGSYSPEDWEAVKQVIAPAHAALRDAAV